MDEAVTNTQKGKYTLLFIILSLVIVLLIGLVVYLLWFRPAPSDTTETSEQDQQQDMASDDATNPPDTRHLPLGDNKFSTEPKLGYVYSCQTAFNGGGASDQGPWIDSENGTWDLSEKISVDGSVNWPTAYFTYSSSGDSRLIASADLPLGHNTGVFPIATSDEAYKYDRNPNSIKTQQMSLELPKEPILLSEPKCVGGEVGIALTGVLIFNAFDAGGRDAVATEVQDSCEGHPQAGGYYHYHGYSSCFKDTSAENEHSDLLGYAYDGFGIYGLKGQRGKELSTQSLDICHGHTHEIDWDFGDGDIRNVEMFHYHMTQDFPYTVSCFRGEPVVRALSSEGNTPGGKLPPKM